MKAIEYALIAALLSIATIGALTAMGGTFDDVFREFASLFGG